MAISSLPSMEHSFHINVEGSDTKKRFTGDFTYRRPNNRAKIEIDKTETRLNGDLVNLNEDTKFVNEVYATLRHTLTACPDWWKDSDYGYDLYDLNVALEIFKEVRAFEKKWFDSIWSSDEQPADPVK